MNCIKTGAVVHFNEYGFVVTADIFAVSGCRIIRWIPGCEAYGNDFLRSLTHMLVLGGDNSFFRQDLGIVVVPYIFLIPV